MKYCRHIIYFINNSRHTRNNMNELDKFGENYILEVRDYSLSLLESILNNEMKAPRIKLLQNEINTFSDKEKRIIEKLVATLIDNTLHNMLLLFEEHPEIEIKYNNVNLVNSSDGLCGELYTDDGWIKKYSKYKSYL